MGGGEASRRRAAEERLEAAGVAGELASALAGACLAGEGASEALGALLDAIDAGRSEVAAREAENARLADENAALGRDLEVSRATAASLRAMGEAAMCNGRAVVAKLIEKEEVCRDDDRVMFGSRSEGAAGAGRPDASRGLGDVAACIEFFGMGACADPAKAYVDEALARLDLGDGPQATGGSAFAGMTEDELRQLNDEERTVVERVRAEALAEWELMQALIAEGTGEGPGEGDDGDGGRGGRRGRAPSPPTAERYAHLPWRWDLVLPDGEVASHDTEERAVAAARAAADAIGLRYMGCDVSVKLDVIPARIVAVSVARPRYKARELASSDLEAKEAVAESVAGHPSLRVCGLERARKAAAGAEAGVAETEAGVADAGVADVAGAAGTEAGVAEAGSAGPRRMRSVFVSTVFEPLVGRSCVTPSLAAMMIVALVCGSVPVWRQLSLPFLLGASGIAPSVAAGWVNLVCERKLYRLLPLLREEMVSNGLLHGDETTIRVLGAGRGRSKSYMWLFSTAVGAARAVRWFCYAPDRKGENAVKALKGFAGVLVTDAYAGYNLLKDVRHAFCLIHARRKFFEAIAAAAVVRQETWARSIVETFDAIFRAERELAGLEPAERLARRRELMAKLVKRIDDLCEAAMRDPGVPRKGKLARAVAYWQNNRDELTAFMGDGSIPLHNMVAEHMARRVSLYRKNSMICGSPRGAKARACMLTIVETARANGLDPHKYLLFVLERMRGDDFHEDAELMRSLLPWSEEAKAACAAEGPKAGERPCEPVGTAA